MKWNRIKNIWYMDIEGVGRYALSRLTRQHIAYWTATLNGNLLAPSIALTNCGEAKREVEERIETAKRIALQGAHKFWLANWACPEDAETMNDDHGATALDLANPSGVIVTTLNHLTIARVQALALQEWLDAIGDDEDSAQTREQYISAKWHQQPGGADDTLVYALWRAKESPLVLGYVIIRRCNSIIGD